jgi:hypothetical protein
MNEHERQIVEEEYWNSWEEQFGYDAYWYEYLSDADKARYKAYLKKVEPMRDIDKEFSQTG